MPFDYRSFMLFDLANKSGLTWLDSAGYFLRLRRKLFDDIERDSEIYYSLVKYNDNVRDRLEGIITIDDGNANLTYYEHIPFKKIEKISKDELVEKFNNGYISFIDYSPSDIPGLCEPYKVYRKVKN
jgi:hypothetical protein